MGDKQFIGKILCTLEAMMKEIRKDMQQESMARVSYRTLTTELPTLGCLFLTYDFICMP
jgi:hypothetical protein